MFEPHVCADFGLLASDFNLASTAAYTVSTSESIQIHFEHVRRWQSTRQSISLRSTQMSCGFGLPFRHHSVGPNRPTTGAPAAIHAQRLADIP